MHTVSIPSLYALPTGYQYESAFNEHTYTTSLPPGVTRVYRSLPESKKDFISIIKFKSSISQNGICIEEHPDYLTYGIEPYW